MEQKQTLVRARETIRQGDKATAQGLLYQVIQANPRSETAWLWLSAIVDDPVKERDCLLRVLAVNPGNEVAQRHLDMLKEAEAPSPKPITLQPSPEMAPVPPLSCPHCGKSVTESASSCTYCGHDLKAVSAPHTAEDLAQTPTRQGFEDASSPTSKASSLKFFWILLALLAGLALLACFVPFLLRQLGIGSTPSQKEYYVEYREAVAQVPTDFNVIFLIRPTPERAEKILRLEWSRYKERDAPKDDVLLNAWYSTTGDYPDVGPLSLGSGSGGLVYYHKMNRLMTWKEYMEATTARPLPSEYLSVTLDLRLMVSNERRARVEATTNLPDGMRLMITLRNTSLRYAAQSQAVVGAGKLTSEWFGDSKQPGNHLLPGTYSVEISSPLAELQPEEVQDVIGTRGERMTGDFVQLGKYGTHVSCSKDFVVR